MDKLTEFYRKVMIVERKKLAAVHDKLRVAQEERNLVRMAGLADCAAKIASRYEHMLVNLLKENKS